jgi:hypothetical protein
VLSAGRKVEVTGFTGSKAAILAHSKRKEAKQKLKLKAVCGDGRELETKPRSS